MKFKRGWKGRYRGYAKVPSKGKQKKQTHNGKVCRKKKKKDVRLQNRNRRGEPKPEKRRPVCGGRREQRARIAFAPVSTGAP